jgi:peptide/nickel transport system substrate-binding protein
MMPRLAEAFGENADGSWTVRLRAGVRSHHGHELTAEDVKWNFDKVFALDTIGAYRWGQIAGLASSEHVEILDKRTLRFHLRAPNPHLPAYLFCGVPLIVDSVEVGAHATDADPWGSDWLSAARVAGFGPYDLEEFDKHQILFRSRDDYWSNRDLAPEVLVERTDSRADALRALNGNDPVYVVGLRCDEAVSVRRNDEVSLAASWGPHLYLGMNYNRPPFNDVRVRHALSYATPYDEVIERGFLGLARPWRSPLTTYDDWYRPDFWNYGINREKAVQLLAAAGYRDGLETALYVPHRPDLERVGEILKAAYREVGVDVDLRDMSTVSPGFHPSFYIRAECGHNFNEAVYDLAHDYAQIQPILPSPRAGGGVDSWLGSYPGSLALEDMYRQILLAPNAAERYSLCLQMQQTIVDSAFVVFLAEVPQISAANESAAVWTRDYESRLVQALHFQNCNTGYLPS